MKREPHPQDFYGRLRTQFGATRRARAYGLFAVASAAFTAVMATLLGCWCAYGVTPFHPEHLFFGVLCGLGWTTVALVGMLSDKRAAPAAAMDRERLK